MEIRDSQEKQMPSEISVDDTIKLRFLLPDDAARIHEIFQADPTIQLRVTWTHGLDGEAAIKQQLIEFQEDKSLRYAILDDGKLVGYVGMWRDNEGYMTGVPEDRGFGFGYFLDPSARGKGIVRKATGALMTQAEQKFDVKTWTVYVEDDNSASQNTLKALGFHATEQTFEEPTMHTPERRWEKIVSNEQPE